MLSKYLKVKSGKLHYYHHENPGKPRLLCLHGYLDTGKSFTFIDPWLQQHFDIVYLEWPGHGKSPLNDGFFHGSALVGVVVEAVNALFDAPFYLLGHSLGAAYGARVAGIISEKIKGIVLFEGFSGLAPIDDEAERLVTWAKQIEKPLPVKKRMLTLKAARNVIGSRNSRLSKETVETLLKNLTKKKRGQLQWHFDERVRTGFIPISFHPELSRALWRRINCPVMVIYGDKTPFNPGRFAGKAKPAGLREEMKEILSHFRDVELKIIEGCGHNFHHENPAAVISLLKEFFSERCPL